MQRRFATLFLLVLVTVSLWAQASGSDASPVSVPHLVKFSGNIAAAPAGTVGVIFALYADETGGAPLWQEVQNVTVDANGRYSAVLGSRSTSGIPVEVFSSNEARWLGVEVQGQAEQSRVLLVSVPYAIKASDAETLGGLPASAFMLANAAQPAAYVNTAAVSMAAKTAVAAISASGATAGNVPMFTDATGDLGASMITQANGNVGIGTATPASLLNAVSGVSDFRWDTGAEGLTPTIAVISTSGKAGAVLAGTVGTEFTFDNSGFFSIASDLRANFTNNNLGRGPQWLTVQGSNGYIGINNTAPAYPLAVNGAIQSITGGFVFPDGTTQTTAATNSTGGGSGVNLSSPDTSITVAGTALAPTVVVNTNLIQSRVAGTCPSGSAIATVSQNGSVTCQAVTGSIVGGGVGLVGTNNFVGQETFTPSGVTAVTPAIGYTVSANASASAAAAIAGTSTDATQLGSGISGFGVNGANGLYGTSDLGYGLYVQASDARIEGRTEVGCNGDPNICGTTTLASPPDSSASAATSVPYNGLVIRRVKADNIAPYTVVAYSQVDNSNPSAPAGISLARDASGANGNASIDGFVLVADPTLSAGIPLSFSCTDNAGASIGSATPLDPTSSFPSDTLLNNGPMQVYAPGSYVTTFHCVFGRIGDAANMTDVTLTRYNADSRVWVGTIISDTNQ
jgi:hypothetical protein